MSKFYCEMVFRCNRLETPYMNLQHETESLCVTGYMGCSDGMDSRVAKGLHERENLRE